MSDITEEDSPSSLLFHSDCHTLSRDPEYYFEDGSIVILVGNVLFKVHKSRLSKDSSTFEAMFGLPPETDKVIEGLDDDNPVVLEGDTPGQFRSLLWFLYSLPHEILKASTPSAGHDWSAFEKFCDLAQMVHKYGFRSTEAWVLSTFVQWLKPTRLIPPRISATATTLNSNGATVALNRSSEHVAIADKVLLERLRRILELAVLCEETELHTAIVQRLQEELSLPNADLPWFIMLGELYNIPTLTGTAYYALMVQGQDRWIALTKEGTLSDPQLSKLHYGYYALVSLWEKYRTMPPVIPSCTHYGHNCRQRWQTYWKDLMKDDHIMAKFPADVLGRLEMVLSQLYSYNGIMDMHQECRSLAVTTIKNMLSEAKINLASNFELSDPEEKMEGPSPMTNVNDNGTVQVDVPQSQSSSLGVPPPTITKQTSHGTQLQAFGDKVKKIPVLPHSNSQGDVKGVDYVYGVEKAFDGRIQLFKYGIGPLELDISYDHHTKGLILDIYLNPPFVKKVKISTVTGSLLEGLVVKLGYGTSLAGQLTIQKVVNEAILSFHFTAFEKEYKGSVKLFSI